MSLAQVLEGQFRGDIRFRGAAYLKAERVSITRVTPENVFAVVSDGVDYQTQLTREGNELRLHCSCAQSDRPSGSCKHLWATILAVDAGGLIAGSIRPGHVPPFASELPAAAPADDYWEQDSYRDVYTPPSASRPALLSSVLARPAARRGPGGRRAGRRGLGSRTGRPAGRRVALCALGLPGRDAGAPALRGGPRRRLRRRG